MSSALSLDRILSEALIQTLPGVYVLGCHHRHITVFSQQVRAINMIDAFVDQHENFIRMRMAVVGAGVAGLTAAAYAAQCGAEVSIFEQASHPLWLQDHCRNRWLHPHIYDWPEAGSLEPRTLVLPVLNWQAGSASDVIAQIREAWEYEVSMNSRIRDLYWGQRVVDVIPRPGATGDAVGVVWETSHHLGEPVQQEQTFDIVVLAVGFGLEGGEEGKLSYWNDIDGLDDIQPHERILISGFGDGGLADVIRLSLMDFRQDQIVRLLQEVDLDEIGEQLLHHERVYAAQPETLDQYYRQLRVEEVVARLEEMRYEGRTIYLAGRSYLYGTRSAILNRFIVSQLQQLQEPVPFEEMSELRVPIQPPNNGKHVVTFKGDIEQEFDRVVLRHGPRPTLAHFKEVWQGVEERARHWRETPQFLDQTRVLTKEMPDQMMSPDEPFKDLESYESSSDIWCLVIHPIGSQTDWRVFATTSLSACRESVPFRMNRSLNPTPLVVSAEEALQNVETYLRAVRALCRADISIVDVSAYNPGIMMLLGIRAAVRRGITIASTECELNAETWSQVPFNLKELNLLSHRPGNARRYEELTESILEALDQRERSSLYQDLPVYDYVRDLGNDYEDYEPVRKDERVLFLRPFGESYQTNSWGFIRQRFQAILQRQKLTPKLESIVDENSPRLVGQRLYDAIRRTDVCVVDFTDWRANVFFELGVRLAVREIGPLCIVDIDRIEETTAIKQHLIALLEPFQYRLAGPETPFRNALNAFEKMQQADPLSYHPNGASLAHDQTYHIASRYFVEDQDRFSMSVEQSLMAAVTAAVGRGDDLQNVNSTQLYGSENEILARRLRDGLLEHLCAAWYYLDGREAPASFDMIDLLNSKKRAVFQDYRTIMGRLEIRLSERVKPRDKHLKAVLEDRKKSMVDRNLFKLDDGLNDWESLWQEVRQVLFSEERELDEAREVGEEYLEVANQLRSMLENLGDVVCQAFLEKIDTSCRMVQNQLNALLS